MLLSVTDIALTEVLSVKISSIVTLSKTDVFDDISVELTLLSFLQEKSVKQKLKKII